MEEENLHLDVLLDLDRRHDQLLVELEELDRRVTQVLQHCQAAREDSHTPSPTGDPSRSPGHS